MGNKIQVHGWTKIKPHQYDYITLYEGESIFKAVIAAVRGKRRSNIGMVKVEWR